MPTFTMTTFETALQAKLNTANVSLSAQDYLLLTKAVKDAIEISNAVSTLAVKGIANGVASLDANVQVPSAQLINALPSQTSNANKVLVTNGSTASWSDAPTFASLSPTLLYVGTGASAFNTSAGLTSPTGVFNVTSSNDSYGQLAMHNASSSSSTDIIAYANNGVDAAGWIDMGITGATFNSATYGITGAHDGYIFMSAPTGTSGKGNLVLATGANGTENKIVFAAGGYDSGTSQMTITPNANVKVNIATPSTSSTTGAFQVVGGVGIQGDMNVQGSVAIQGTITFGGAGTTVSAANLSVTDPLVFVGNANSADIVDLGLVVEYATTVSTITKTVSNKALTSNVATLTTSATHGFAVGDYVVVSSVDATFNGTYIIYALPHYAFLGTDDEGDLLFDPAVSIPNQVLYAKTADDVARVASSGTLTITQVCSWITAANIEDWLGIGTATAGDAAFLTVCAAASSQFAWRRRMEAGYVDSLTVVPSQEVLLGTQMYGGALSRQRGSMDQFASFQNMGTTPVMGLNGMIRQLLGIDRPQVA